MEALKDPFVFGFRNAWALIANLKKWFWHGADI
jgi:hypothetical protein